MSCLVQLLETLTTCLNLCSCRGGVVELADFIVVEAICKIKDCVLEINPQDRKVS